MLTPLRELFKRKAHLPRFHCERKIPSPRVCQFIDFVLTTAAVEWVDGASRGEQAGERKCERALV